MTRIAIRPARTDETERLSDICRRAKAHWGYDAAFMAASEVALTITPAMIVRGRVLLAESAPNEILGVATAEPLAAKGAFDLGHMFVEPNAMGSGVGRKLFEAIVALIAAEGAKKLVILADPNAEEFYRRMGAARVGDAPSDSIPGRRLPLLEYEIG
jgi:N-acetylglutamate synthase-like GNAT family acetyltransferase